MAKSRSTKVETDKRVFTVQGWIIQGVPDYLILKQIVDNWTVTDRQARSYLAKAYKDWRASAAATVEERRQLRIDELKQDIRAMKDAYKGTPAGMRVIFQIKREISRLEGLHLPKVVAHQGGGDNTPPIQTSVRVEIVQTGKKIATSEDDVDM